MTPDRFKELLAKAKARLAEAKEAENAAMIATIETGVDTVNNVDLTAAGISEESLKSHEGRELAVDTIQEIISEAVGHKIIGVAREVTLNTKQQQLVTDVLDGHDCVLIGAAGTGKTTSVGVMTKKLMEAGKIGKIDEPTKYLKPGLPGATIVSFTRKAVNNIRYAVADELKAHTLTIHKLLEFAPVRYEIENKEKPGEFIMTMRFEPMRNETNPLPRELSFLAFEESSMIGVELYRLLQNALPHYHQEVFLGDINQIPPVFGVSILGFKMLELPVIELTEVYRQALESPIIELAHKILGGNPNDFSSKTETKKVYHQYLKREVSRINCPALDQYSKTTSAGKVHFQVWQKKLTDGDALLTAIKQFNAWIDDGYFNPNDDIILCPYNKAFGTIELNKGIAQHLGIKRDAVVTEVIAGFNRYYHAVGDRVLYDKEDAVIVSIARNGEYMGKRPTPPSVHLDRWGCMQAKPSDVESFKLEEEETAFDIEAAEKMLESTIEEIEDRTNAASHVITIKYTVGDEKEEVLSTASEINNLLGGYAITFHKFQGCENDKVFLVLHNSHIKMVQRELLYTGVTRASKFLHIICEIDTFEKGVKSQRILGNTIAEKAEVFKGKIGKEGFDVKTTHKNGPKDRPVEFHPGTYKGDDKQSPVITAPKEVISYRKEKIISFRDMVSQAFKDAVHVKTDQVWERATSIWGPKIGRKPLLTFNLQINGVAGRADIAFGEMKLNPVFCALADENEQVRNFMVNETLVHELCHIIAYRYSGEKAHGTGWKMTMQLMGLEPNVHYDEDDLPAWAEAYKEVLLKKQEEMRVKSVVMEEVE